MNTFSHYMLGDLILRHLRDHHDVRLDRNAFLRGNMVPDFSRTYKSKPHKPAYWARFLQKETGALSVPHREGACYGESYSRRLGIVCHFYSDFFCRAHTVRFDGGSYEHIKYEWLLDRRLRARLPLLKGTDYGETAPVFRNAARISALFEELQRDYLGTAPSIDNDLAFTLRACCAVVTAVTLSARAGFDETDGLTVLLPPVGEPLVSVT
jgi:hypothetical protein